MEVANAKDKEKAYPLANFETPYVVRLWNTDVLSDPQACFTFNHPNKGFASIMLSTGRREGGGSEEGGREGGRGVGEEESFQLHQS